MGPNLTERLKQPRAIDHFEDFLDGCERILCRIITPANLLTEPTLFSQVCCLGQADEETYTPDDIRSWAEYEAAQQKTFVCP